MTPKETPGQGSDCALSQKEQFRRQINETFPDMPLNEKEETVDQIMEITERYGEMRLMTIGDVVIKTVAKRMGRKVEMVVRDEAGNLVGTSSTQAEAQTKALSEKLAAVQVEIDGICALREATMKAMKLDYRGNLVNQNLASFNMGAMLGMATKARAVLTDKKG